MTLKDIIIAGKLTISEGGGGGGAQVATGTFIGDDSDKAKFSCDFDPDVVYIKRINAVSLPDRVFAGFIGYSYGGYEGYQLFQHNANTTTDSGFGGDLGRKKFSYSDGMVSIPSMSTRPVSSQCEYYYCAVKWTE